MLRAWGLGKYTQNNGESTGTANRTRKEATSKQALLRIKLRVPEQRDCGVRV